MKNIDDKMIEKALRELKRRRRWNPIISMLGIIPLVVAGFLGHLIFQISQHPWPQESLGGLVFITAQQTFLVGFLACVGMFMLCNGLFGLLKNPKDIILEYLAEQYLNSKQESGKEQVNKPDAETGK